MGAILSDNSPLGSNIQALERAEAIHVQVLERHVYHGIEHVMCRLTLLAHRPQATGQLAVPESGDVNMAQFIQGHVAKLDHK